MTRSARFRKTAQSPNIASLTLDQLEAAGTLVYEAFLDIATRHNFEPPFESPEFARFLVRFLNSSEGFTSFVASEGGQPVAVNFLDERNEIAGVGPVAVSVAHQGRRLGRVVMEALLERAERFGYESVRLLQAAYNLVSFSLYSALGFEVKDGMALVRGRPRPGEHPAGVIRECEPSDLDALDGLSMEVLGFRRRGDIESVMAWTRPLLVERDGRPTGFVCRFATPDSTFLGPAVARDEETLRDLIAGAAMSTPGELRFLLPVSCPWLLRWALQGGFSLVELDTLMVRGAYEAPAGAYMPSAWY
ncbi:MAG: GNAT family N-acetyltransferase [Chloroflexota bacterium]|nr:GNAT family N-acetyltransferase [Chloroflexota bacterium]